MDRKIIKFDETEIEEYKFQQYKNPISINDIDINEIVVSNKFSFGKQDYKYFIGYKDNQKIRPLYIFFPEMSAYRMDFDETECMSFLIKDKKFLEKYNQIQEKPSEPVYNKNDLKAEKKSYNEKVNKKKGCQCIYISVILIVSVYIKDKNYYSQVFLEKYKYVREKKMSNFITDNIEINSDDSDEKTRMKKIKSINLF